MNINTNFPNVSLVTANPATISVARENELRPMIPASRGVTEGVAEKAVAGEQEKVQPAGVTVQLSGSYELAAGEETEQASGQRSEGEEGDGSAEQDENADNPSREEAGASEQDNREGELTEQELQLVENLKARDAEVVRHEQAHASVGGQHAGSPSYDYQSGPDGKRYAVGGEVSIDTSPVANDPQATIRKAEQIKAAALAPAEPSGQDRRVAASADAMAAQARQEIATGSADDEQQSANGVDQSKVQDGKDEEVSKTLAAEKASQNDDALVSQMQQRNAVISQRYQNAYGASAQGQFVGQA